jgi:hypothetical protein
MNIIKNIILISYIKNKGVWRVCFVLGALLGCFAFSINSRNALLYGLLWFYIPFFIACLIRWIYVGFKESKTHQKVEN